MEAKSQSNPKLASTVGRVDAFDPQTVSLVVALVVILLSIGVFILFPQFSQYTDDYLLR